MASRPYSRLALPARLAFWGAVLLCSAMALLPQPPQVPLGDKSQHMLAFFVLTVLAQIGMQGVSRWAIALRLSLFGALIELVQAVPIINRDADFGDWVADTLVVVLVTAVFVWRDALRR